MMRDEVIASGFCTLITMIQNLNQYKVGSIVGVTPSTGLRFVSGIGLLSPRYSCRHIVGGIGR